MKLNRHETHDRLLHLQKDQALNLAQGAEDCLKKNYLSTCLQQYSPYIYIFAHPRTADDGYTKRMIWQPRLTKPKAQTNSYLFRAISNTDQMEICWMLPPQEMWLQYTLGKMTEHETVIWSIKQYQNHRHQMEMPDPEDLPEDRIKEIYLQIGAETDQQTLMDKLYEQ